MLPKKVIESYDASAKAYAEKFAGELSKKHFDRLILEAFVKENSGKGKMIDLGCGPGQTTYFLSQTGVSDILGTDVSGEMIKEARVHFPKVNFEVADMLRLKHEDSVFASAIAFYAIVHFNKEQLQTAFSEIKRILKPRGQFLFSFHIGDEIIRNTNFLEQGVELDFYFFETESILEQVQENGFKIIDVIERYPYPEAEYPSRRAYVWLEKI